MTESTTRGNVSERDPYRPTSETSGFEPACALIGAWLSDALNVAFEGPPYKRAQDIWEAAAEQLEAGAFGEVVPKEMSGLLHKLLSEEREDDEAARLWGCAVARAAVSAPDRLFLASYLVENLFVALDALVGALTERLRSGTADRLLDSLQGIVTSIRDHPDEDAFSPDKARFRQIVHERKKAEHVDTLWRQDFGYVYWSHQGLRLIHALRPVDRQRYLAMLEETALPQAVEQELWAIDLRSNFPELLALLEAAPSVQSAPEQPQWNGRMTAPILLSVAIEHVNTAAGAQRGDDLTEEQEEVAKALLGEVVSILLARADGRFLALYWLAYLIGEHQRNAGMQKRSVVSSAIGALSDALVAGGAGYADVQWAFSCLTASMSALKALRERGAGPDTEQRGISATDAFLAAVLLEIPEERLRTESSGSALLETYRVVLLKRDPGLRTLDNHMFPNERHFSPALLFCDHEDPGALWREIWLLLSEQRRRAQGRISDIGSEDPSFFHLCVGIGLVDWLIEKERPGDAKRVWDEIFDGAFPIALTLGRVAAGRWRHAIAKLFARLPHIVQAQNPSADAASEAANQLARIGGDDEWFVWCAAMLRLNGIGIADLAHACQQLGMDLIHRFEEFLTWEIRPGNRRPVSPVIIQIKEILTELKPPPRTR
ncbi:hypothetical protein [Azospirillum argentinense]|uniref:hypothetical protein n=3 Tax=Azospirillum argentinense TaxID=2970906 RepID=UPI000A727431|nr:hypothetical protein [Azospirillum argentinense]